MTSPDTEQALQARDQARHKQAGIDDLSRHQSIDGTHDRQQDEWEADASAERYQEMLKHAKQQHHMVFWVFYGILRLCLRQDIKLTCCSFAFNLVEKLLYQ